MKSKFEPKTLRQSCHHELFCLALQSDQKRRMGSARLSEVTGWARAPWNENSLLYGFNLLFHSSPLTSQYNYSDLLKRLLIYLPLCSSSRELSFSQFVSSLLIHRLEQRFPGLAERWNHLGRLKNSKKAWSHPQRFQFHCLQVQPGHLDFFFKLPWEL